LQKDSVSSRIQSLVANLKEQVDAARSEEGASRQRIVFVPHPAERDRTTLYDIVSSEDVIEIHTYFHDGQTAAIESTRRIIAIIAGTQGGKTSFGPLWLLCEILKMGGGDYGIITPTFSLLDRKALPEFIRLFKESLGLGTYFAQRKKFVFSKKACDMLFGGAQCSVFFSYATNPESLESATWKAAWLDEAGQTVFQQNSYEAIRRRLSINRGRILITTTPYNLGWLKTQVWDKYHEGDERIDVIRFDSTTNPAFSKEEMEEAERDLPAWKYNQFYRGIFSRTAGVIYESYDDRINYSTCRNFEPPPHWRRVISVDFGAVNFAAVFFCQSAETGIWYVYRTYYPAERMSTALHVANVMRGEPADHPDYQCLVVGGARSEDEWRNEFADHGLCIERPRDPNVSSGIQKGFALFSQHRLYVMVQCDMLRSHLQNYQYEVMSDGTVNYDKIVDKKKMHLMDAFRYGCVEIASMPSFPNE